MMYLSVNKCSLDQLTAALVRDTTLIVLPPLAAVRMANLAVSRVQGSNISRLLLSNTSLLQIAARLCCSMYLPLQNGSPAILTFKCSSPVAGFARRL